MQSRKYLFFILMLFLIIFSTSFVSANDITQANSTAEIIMLSNDDNGIDDVQLESNDASSEAVLGQAVDAQNTDEIENDTLLTYSEDVQQLRTESPDPGLAWVTSDYYGGSLDQIARDISNHPGGHIICLHGGYYWGNPMSFSNLDLGRFWIYGGEAGDDGTTMATIDCQGTAFTFTGTKMNDVKFYNIITTNSFMTINQGSMNEVLFENCQSNNGRLIDIYGLWNGRISVTNSKFTNCTQKGQGQFAFIVGAELDSCEFIDSKSADNDFAITTHGTSMNKVNFTRFNAKNGFMDYNCYNDWNQKGELKDCKFEDSQSAKQFLNLNYNQDNDGTFDVSGCKFINCNQTSGTFDDNTGSFINAKGATITSCEVTNISVGSTGYAFRFAGTTINNAEFDNITTDKFMTTSKTNGNSHSYGITDSQFKNIQSDDQFLWIIGDDNPVYGIYPITNTKFINCSQTNASGNNGIFANIYSTAFTSCEFINISSAATCYTFWTEGTRMDKVNFTGVNMSGGFMHAFRYDHYNHEGYLRDCIFKESQSVAQFVAVIGDNSRGAFEVSRCKFINCNQTYNDFKDGRGQFVAAIGANIDSCEFINTSSGHHGGAICINDEIANIYNVYRASSVTNTNFTNIKSAWFAVFVHGLHNDSAGNVEKPILIENCNFINCTATEQYGAGIGISHDNTTVRNCKFINNTGGQGTAIMVGGIPNSMNDTFDGDNSKGNNIKIEDCTFINNTAQSHPCRNDTYSTGNGGAIYVYGNYTSIERCTFENNNAGSGNGSAIYIEGFKTSVEFSKFTNHTSVDGTVYIEGDNSTMFRDDFYENDAKCGAGFYLKGDNSKMNGCGFYNNTAEYGAGVYAEGDKTVVFNSTFEDNTVTNQGGAVFLEGDGSTVDSNKFIHNEAIPSKEETTGLGGGVYLKGENTQFNNDTFTHNIARNGSAIYTEGKNVRVSNEVFNENQAWSYVLIVTPDPKVSYYNTTDVNVTVVHIGGDNIINAIHNKESYTEIMLNNVTYTHSNGKSYHTDAVYVRPADGAENSNNGTVIYQDDREYLQNITLCVTHEDGEVIINSTDGSLQTDIYGEVTVTLKRPRTRSVHQLSQPLRPGDYEVYATHPEDWNYKFIENTNTFKVIAYADLSINKTVSNATVHRGDTVYWNITVKNNGPNDAVGVVVEDVIPEGLIDVEAVGNIRGTFNVDNCSWYGFDLANGESAVLMLKTVVDVTNKTLVNEVNVTSKTEDNDLSNNNATNKTYVLPEADLEIIKLVSNKTVHNGDVVNWTIIVTNHGPDDALNVVVEDVIPEGLTDVKKIDATSGNFIPDKRIWNGFDLESGKDARLIIQTTVTVTNKTLINKVNVTSDTYDPDLSNNNASNKTFALPEADLKIVKKVLNSTAHKGEEVYWNITVSNLGPDEAINVVMKDFIPEGLTDVESVEYAVGKFDESKLEWYGFNLTKDASATLVIKTKVDVTNTTLVNKVNVTSDTYDPDLSNNNDSDKIAVPPEADLEIVKLVSNETVLKGDAVEWTIVVTNNGPDAAINVVVKDVIPEGLTYIKTIKKTAGYFSSEDSIWTGFSLESGKNATLIIKTSVDVSNKTIVNKVNVTSDTYDPDLSNNNASNQTVALPETDLEIIKKVLNSTAHKGDVIYWNITVTNLGPDDAVNVVVKDVIPEGLTDVKVVEYDVGKFDEGKLVWDGFDLAHSDSASLVIKTTVDATNTTLINKVNVTSDTHETDLTNNNDSDKIAISPEADLEIIKLVSDKAVHKGDAVNWTIVVTNNGPDAAVNVVVKDVIPEGLTDVKKVNATAGIFDSEKLVWSDFNLESGKNATLIIQTTVDATNKTLINKVSVTSDTRDPDLSNNNASNETFALPDADLKIVKNVLNDTARKGDVIYWNITVTNLGPDEAVNVVVKDVIPEGLTDVKSVEYTVGEFDAGKLEWYGFNLAKGASASLVIMTTVDVTNKTLVNKVNVTSDTYDPNETNNNDSDEIVIPPEADLSIVKEALNDTARKGDVIYWSITVTNNGPDDAVNVAVKDVIPEGLSGAEAVGDIKGTFDESKGIWYDFNLANGASATLVIKTTVGVTNDTLVNKVNVTSDTYDPNETNNNDSDDIVIPPEADLSIVKEALNDTARKGDVIYWKITVTNNGPDDAVNVVVKDVIPEGLTGAGAVGDIKGTFDESKGTWYGFNLTNGASATLVIMTTVDVTNATLINKVNVTSDTYDPNTTNNNDSDEIPIPPEADLEIIKLVSNKSAIKGDTVDWTIIVTNKGPDAAVNVTVTDFLPEGLINVVEVKRTAGKFDADKLVWNQFNLASGANATLIIRTTLDVTNVTLVNTVNVTSDTYDPDTSNNNASNETGSSPEADLSIVKLVSNNTAIKGDVITWTIEVTNNGPDAAVNVVVKDVLPSELVDVSVSSISAGEFKNGVWSGFGLESGKTAVLIIETTVDATNTIITNKANVTSDTYDPDTSNNNASNETVVSPEADLSIEKQVSDAAVNNGDVVSWTIVVTNNGPDAAVNVVVNDALPGELIVVDVAPSVGAFNNGVWSGFDLASGETAKLVVKTRVSTTNATVVNKANVTSDTYDPDTSNNNASNETVVSPEADLSIVKLVSDKTVDKGDVITWTIEVTNNGPDSAVNVVVNDAIPDGLVDVSVSSISAGEFKNGVWSGFDLESGKTAVLIIKTTADATGTTIVNKANVTSDTRDPDTTNNNASNETVVSPEADLSIVKEVSNGTVHKGDVIYWTIAVTNNGPDDAVNVVVNDAIPDGLVDVSVSEISAGEFKNNVWSGFNLNSGKTAVLVLKTTANVSNKTIVNTVDVTSDTYDSDLTNNGASNKTYVIPEVDLNIKEYVSNETAKNGDIIYWKIVVNNTGSDNAENVVVKDILPEGLEIIDVGASKGEYKDGVWSDFDLMGDDEAVLYITARVNSTKFTINNKPSVDSDTYDTNPENNNASNETILRLEADLEIIKNVSPESARMGDIISWEIVVINHGPDEAINAFATDLLPDGLEYVSDDSDGKFDYRTGIWDLGTLLVGDSKTLHIFTKVLVSNAVIVNNAEVTSDTYDPNMENNKDSSSVTVKPEVDLAIIITPKVTKVTVGDKVEFTVTVVNNGPDTAVNTIAMIELPDELKLLKFNPSRGTFDAETGIWTIGDLAPGEKVTLLLTAEALKTGKFVVGVSTKCDIHETDYTNNKDAAIVKVVKNETPVEPDIPSKHSKGVTVHTMPATGNPIAMVLLSLFAIVVISFKRKNKF